MCVCRRIVAACADEHDRIVSRYIISVLGLAAALFAAQSIYSQECPLIVVDCPAVSNSSNIEFRARTVMTLPSEQHVFTWSLSAGRIVRGQGTATIEVGMSGNADHVVTATAEVNNFPRECSKTASCTIRVVPVRYPTHWWTPVNDPNKPDWEILPQEARPGEVILSKDNRSWGSFWYNDKQDQLRAKIQIREIPHTELLTFDFINATKTSAELVLNWEKKQFPVKVEFAVDDIVMANATEELKGAVGFTWQGFASAANYALQNKVNYDQAVKWIDQAIAQNRNFTTLNVKSGLLKAKGETAEAEKMMTEAIAVATENELNLYGYQLMNQGQQDKAIEMFKLNTERHPRSANTWDSLGEGYYSKGDKKNAIANFKKSLSMNPPANVKANSEKYLKQMGAL